ncbi:MAG: cell cycle transcriptional regulator TrcR [Rickettsiaceae bacterium]
MVKNYKLPIMPKSTAIWLIENTALTFKQIADFCGMHELEIASIADNEIANHMRSFNPVMNGQLTQEEIDRCTQNPNAQLMLSSSIIDEFMVKKKKHAKYTPIARRQDKPDAIYWLLKHCPGVSDRQIIKLIGTTKGTIETIKDKSHWNFKNLRLRDPVLLGLCTQGELNKLLEQFNDAQSDNLTKQED